MHAGTFIELAAELTLHSTTISRSSAKEMVPAEEFWQLSKEKLSHWKKTLAIFAEDVSSSERATTANDNHSPWTAISCVVTEILCSEFFARIAAASFVHKDRTVGMPVNAPVGRAVLLFHLEARMRALELIQKGLQAGVAEAKELNALRSKLERWCDLLLAFFPAEISEEFSFERNRRSEFDRDLGEESPTSRVTVERLLKMSMREYARALVKKPAANPTLNRRQYDLFGFMGSMAGTIHSQAANFETQMISDLTNDAERWISDYLTVG